MPKPTSNPPEGGLSLNFEVQAARAGALRRRRGPRRRPAEEVAAQVRRYGRSHRLALLSLAREHPHLEDLLFSCPVAAVSLADRRGPPAARGEALSLLRRGAGLSEAMAALELPLWLRKLAPEACAAAPPWPFPRDPGRAALRRGGEYDPRADAEFGRRALSLLPDNPRAQRGFLRWIAAARDSVDDDFALWLMSGRLDWPQSTPEQALPVLAAYVWFSRRPEHPASGQAPRPWSPALSAPATLRDLRRWRVNLCFAARRREEGSLWSVERKARGFVVTPLETLDALIEEGEAMRNCMASYVDAAAMGVCRLYAIRRGEGSVANLEIRPGREAGVPPRIAQLLGKRNAKAGAGATAAAKAWLATVLDEHAALGADPNLGFAPPDPAAWKALMGPFLNGLDAEDPAAALRTPAAMNGMQMRLDRMAAGRSTWRLGPP